jgi:hypothetical protein
MSAAMTVAHRVCMPPTVAVMAVNDAVAVTAPDVTMAIAVAVAIITKTKTCTNKNADTWAVVAMTGFSVTRCCQCANGKGCRRRYCDKNFTDHDVVLHY